MKATLELQLIAFRSVTTSGVLGLVRQESKARSNARFHGGITLADEIMDMALKSLHENSSTGPEISSNEMHSCDVNHSMKQQTISVSNPNSKIPSMQKKSELLRNRFAEESSTRGQRETKYIGNKSSEGQVQNRTSTFSDSWKKFLTASIPSGYSHPSDKVKNSSTQHSHIPVPNRITEDDDFAELGSPSPDLRGKLAPAFDKSWNVRKEYRPSAVSGPTLVAESFHKGLDNASPPSGCIPARKPFVRSNKNTGRRLDHVHLPELRFILGDDLRVDKERKNDVRVNNERKDELAMKEKAVNEVKELKTNHEGSKAVNIKNVPPGISLHHVREAISIYGEIMGSFFKTGENGMSTCHIEFKTVEAKERALAARWIFVNGKRLLICRIDFPGTTIVRITNLSPETSENTVHAVCMSFGNVESLQTRKDGAMDVCFSVSDGRNMVKILEKLNGVVMNHSHWIAQPAPRLSPDLAKTPEGQKWVGLQLNSQIGNIRKHLELKRIYLEDMEELHNAVMHIRESPNSGSDKSFAIT